MKNYDSKTNGKEGRKFNFRGKEKSGEGELGESQDCPTEEAKARFWQKVNKSGPLPDQSKPEYFGLTECWEWTGCIASHGYGSVRVKEKSLMSHRASWIIHNGPIPSGGGAHGMCVCHKCDNPKCVNPDHLFLGTHKQNMEDMVSKGRRPSITGDAHFARSRPHLLARGDRAGRSLKPWLYPVGERVNTAKLTEDDVRNMRLEYASGMFTYQALSRKYNVTKMVIGWAIRRKSWKHVL